MAQYCSFCQNELRLFYKFEDYDVLYCRKCKMAFKKDLVGDNQNPSSLYNSDYIYNISDYFAYEKAEERALRQVSYLNGLPEINPGRLLDIGCSRGYFLKFAYDRGWQPYGIDVSNTASKYAKDRFGLSIFVGQLADANFSPEFFDVITMWDVLEHLPNLDSALSLVYKWLKHGGFLILETPNFNSIYRKIIRKYWCGFTQYHLYYFSIFSLINLLNKHRFEIFWKETPNINFFSQEGMWRFRITKLTENLKNEVRAMLGKVKIGQKTIKIYKGLMRDSQYRAKKRKFFTNIINFPTNFIFGYFKLGDQIRIVAKKISLP